MNPHGFRKTSSPKFVVPHVSEHESGSASSTVSRVSSGSCTEPPVDSWTMRSVSERTASTDALSNPRSNVGAWSASRMCRWISAAPAASQRLAVSTSSSRVVGSWGRSALACSAPVGATVMRVPTGVDEVAMAPIMSGHCRRFFGDQPLTTTVWDAAVSPTRRSTSSGIDRLITASAIGPSS